MRSHAQPNGALTIARKENESNLATVFFKTELLLNEFHVLVKRRPERVLHLLAY